MPEGSYRINVVCSHKASGKTRRIFRLSWLETDPEDEAAFRSALVARSGHVDEEALKVILTNDRFGVPTKWIEQHGRNSALTYDAGSDVVDRARALGAFRFRCRCGIDRPVRQSTLDAWIRDQIESDPSRRAFEYDIAS